MLTVMKPPYMVTEGGACALCIPPCSTAAFCWPIIGELNKSYSMIARNLWQCKQTIRST